MKNIIALALLSALFVPLAGCGGGRNTFKEGDYKGTGYKFQSRTSSGLFSDVASTDWRVKLGSLPAVPVDATVTDWGPPYSTDIYGTDAYLYIPGGESTYHNEPDTPGSIGVFHTMLYISPKTLSEEDFEIFYHFMQEEWPRLRPSVTGKDPREFPDIIGLVYGTPDKYRQEFRGSHEGRRMVLRIEPDGRVRLVDDDKWSNESYSGLSQKVQMPGKWLLQNGDPKAGGLTREELHAFRNKQDVAADAFFKIQPAPAEMH